MYEGCYLTFPRRAAKLRGEMGIPYADKALMLWTWIAGTEAKGLDPVVLRRPLKDVLSFRVEEQGLRQRVEG